MRLILGVGIGKTVLRCEKEMEKTMIYEVTPDVASKGEKKPIADVLQVNKRLISG